MIQVADNIFRGPYMLPFTHTGDIDITLDLETGAHWTGDEFPLDEALLGDIAGVRVYSHPLGTILPPSVQQLRLAVRFLRDKAKNQRVYFHCHHGVDRTGMVAASYRIIVDGWSPLAAIKEMIGYGFHWYFYFYWIPQLWRVSYWKR